MDGQVAEEDRHQKVVCLGFEGPLVGLGNDCERVDEYDGRGLIEQLKPQQKPRLERTLETEEEELSE